ncbi:cellulose biosynthesis protein BcsF, partial [Escherichia coli]
PSYTKSVSWHHYQPRYVKPAGTLRRTEKARATKK